MAKSPRSVVKRGDFTRCSGRSNYPQRRGTRPRIEVFDFGLQGRAGKPKEDDTGMGKLVVKDQLAEIPISDDQHTRLFPGNGQDIVIGKTRRIMARDCGNVMATLTKVGNQSKVSALVE